MELLTPEAVSVLAQNHSRFLAFLQRRVASREVAEDILQDAFVKGLQHADALRDESSAVAWFYRMLRNALVDYYRHRDVETRSLERYALETDDVVEPDDELLQEVCACVGELLATLKPEYADAVRRVEMEGAAVKDYAEEQGMTANAAGVRLFRAREALKRQMQRSCGTCAEHKCLDCSCRKKGLRAEDKGLRT